jgi:hypothetical protein
MKVIIDKCPKQYDTVDLEDSLLKLKVPQVLLDYLLPCIDSILDNTINKWNHQNIKVEIKNHDVWDMDFTLAQIILPMLKKWKRMNDQTKYSYPVDNEDVPHGIYFDSDKPVYEYTEDEKELLFQRWQYVLGHIIHAFELHMTREDWQRPLLEAEDGQGLNEEEDYIQKGFELFGKHYQNFWM